MLIHLDGFDSYITLADLYTEYTGSSSTFSTSIGRFGGGGININNGAGFIKSLASPTTELWTSFAIKPTGYTGAGTLLQIISSAGIEVTITYQSLFTLLRGGYGGTSIATAMANNFLSGAWRWIDVHYKYGASAGVVELWLDGVQIINFTGNTTSAGGGSCSQISFGASNFSNNVNCTIDDLYIINATNGTNTTRLGDCRIGTIIPASNASPNNGAGTGILEYSLSSSSTLNTSANYLYLSQAIAAPFTGTLTGISLPVSAIVASGLFLVAIYDSAGNNVLATSTALTSLSAGWNTFTFVTPLSVTAGTQYRIALQQNTTYVPYLSSISGNMYYKSLTYNATFPTNPSFSSSGSMTNFAWVYSPVAPNYLYVNESQWNTTGYVTLTNTTGQEELYNMTALPSVANTVYGLRVLAVSQKSDAGGASLIPICVSSSSEGDGSAQTVSTSWARQYSIFETDPHTTVAWTPSAITSVSCGVKVA